MNTLTIIGASYLQLPLVKKAKEMGYIPFVLHGQKGRCAKMKLMSFIPFL